MTPAAISEASGVDSGRILDVLRGLVACGLAVELSGGPLTVSRFAIKAQVPERTAVSAERHEAAGRWMDRHTWG